MLSEDVGRWKGGDPYRADDPDALLDGHFSEGLLLSVLHTIGGGTSEIQRDLISTVGLGMPR